MSELYSNYLSSIGGGGALPETLRCTEKAFSAYIEPFLPTRRDARILDLGCGFGKYVHCARSQGFTNISGVDLSPEQIAFGRTALGLDGIDVADALGFLSRCEAAFDAILLIDVLEHCEIDYSIKLLSAIRKALAPNGLLLVQVPNGLTPLAPNFLGDVTHVRAYSSASLAQVLRLGGFAEFSLHAEPPIAKGIAGVVRWALWHVLIRPLILAYLVAATGDAQGGIYTPNMLAVARKRAGA
jgi:SAM-dependent methyltransferase